VATAFKVITPVVSEPVALQDAKAYLRVDYPDEDQLITDIISRARQYAETVTHRAFATQQIQQIDTITRPEGGVLSGPIKPGPNWYVYQEQLGANPFGPAQYYHDLAMPPVQASQPYTVQTKITAFDVWTTFPLAANPDGSLTNWIDDTMEPARWYFSSPITANFWMFQYWTGYSSSYPLPYDLRQCLMEMIAYWFDNREAEDLPQPLLNKLLARRVDGI
jgi:Phage gp6-like head-tail connector protein